MKPEDILFPHDSIRDSQSDLVIAVKDAVEKGENLVVHAPTGLGKTAATIAPALKYAIDNDKTVYFLTSRHTQHKIAIETCRLIKEKYDVEFGVADIIGKRWMCIQPGALALKPGEFTEYCKTLREEGQCPYYNNARKKGGEATVQAKQKVAELKRKTCHTEELIKECGELCPYEVALELAKDSNVVVTDYYYLFNDRIRFAFFSKTEKMLDDAIIIIDEGHNLPDRIRELMTIKLTTFILDRAWKEADKYRFEETASLIRAIHDVLDSMAVGEEKLVPKQEFMDKISKICDYDQLVDDLDAVGDQVRQKQRASFIGSVAEFLDVWREKDEGFVRYASEYEGKKSLIYRCMDPAMFAKEVVNKSHSTILMSGTLTPTKMYADLLGFEESTHKEYLSPFPAKNRLNMVIPQTSTKYSTRSEEQYQKIGGILAEIANNVPGNTAMFFPSYKLRDSVAQYFDNDCVKTTFREEVDMSKEEKAEMLERFKGYGSTGAALLAVTSGSFGEGIDYRGEMLKCVVVVGLPLGVPTLEVKELIKYYDTKFGKGWDYGYTLPAITKSLQNAGRCIRSETDKGIVVFLDERYAWDQYLKCFPKDWDVKITGLYVSRIQGFFRNIP